MLLSYGRLRLDPSPLHPPASARIVLQVRYSCIEQMGHPCLSDFESVTCLTRPIIAACENSPAECTERTERPSDCSVESPGFRACLFLYGAPRFKDSPIATIELVPKGPGRRRARQILVSWFQTNRRLDHPRVWRVFGGMLDKRRARKHTRLTVLHLAREIYVGPKMPAVDLEAQLIIAVLQLGCAPRSGALSEWLVSYVRRYKFRIGKEIPARARKHIKDSVAYLVANALLERWSFPEDYRAFRQFVHRGIARELAAERSLLAGYDDAELPIRYDEDEPTAGAGSSGIKRSSLTGTHGVGHDCSDLSVAQVAEHLNVSESYVYRLVRLGRIVKQKTGVIRIAGQDLETIRDTYVKRSSLREKRKELEAAGKQPSAARKAVLRKYGRAPRIV